MNYQLRPMQVRAIQLPETAATVVVGGLDVPPGNWLVVCEGEVLTFSDEEFQKRFEPIPQGMPPNPAREKRVYHRASAQPSRTDAKPATTGSSTPVRPGTISEVLKTALQKQPMTLDQCLNLARQSHPETSQQSVYAVLYQGKVKHGWIFDDDHGVWRFPLTATAKGAAGH
jgi:hypothetical protein